MQRQDGQNYENGADAKALFSVFLLMFEERKVHNHAVNAANSVTFGDRLKV